MDNSGKIESYLVDRRKSIEEIKIRDRQLKVKPSVEFITAVYGPRRSGKSYLFYLIDREFDLEDVMYLNFEDLEIREWTARDVVESVSDFQEIFGREPKLILLDEIQNVPDWEAAVLTLYERKRYMIMITGSSSKLLSKEISTSLRGRSLKYILLPLSFREYLDFKDVEIGSRLSTRDVSELKSHLKNYLSSGSFPGLINEPDLSSRFYEEYMDLVVYRDLVERYGISNLALLRFMMRSVIASHSKEFSVNKLYNSWKSMRHEVGRRTVYQYFDYLQDAMFALTLRKCSPSMRTSDLSTPKVYLPDPGLASHVMGYQPGRAIENCVFLELMRSCDRNPGMEIFFWKDRGREADFVVRSGQEITEIIQVAYELNEDNEKREIQGLLKCGMDLGCSDLKMITWTGEESVPDGVEIVPLWKYLLG